MKTIPQKEAIRFGWETTKKNLGFFLPLFSALFISVIIAEYLIGLIESRSVILALPLNIVVAVIGIIIGMGLIKISLLFFDGHTGTWNDLISQTKLFWNYIAASILYGLIVLCGFVLFIVPGIMWSVRFNLFRFLVVDKNMGPIEALKKSSHITKGARWELFLFTCTLGLINIAGALLFIVGLLFTVPLSMLAYAFVYRKLLQESEATLSEHVR